MSFAKAAAAVIVKCGAEEDRNRKLKKALLAIAGIGGIAGLGGLAYANRHTLFPSLTGGGGKSWLSPKTYLDAATTPQAVIGAAIGPAAATTYMGSRFNPRESWLAQKLLPASVRNKLPESLPRTNSRDTLGAVAANIINNPSKTREQNSMENLLLGSRNEDYHAAIQPGDSSNPNPLKGIATDTIDPNTGTVIPAKPGVRPGSIHAGTTVGDAIKQLKAAPGVANPEMAALLARLQAIAGPRHARFQPVAALGRAAGTAGLGYMGGRFYDWATGN